MKRLVELTVEDLRANPVWRYEGGSGGDALVEPAKRDSLSRGDDEIFLAATAFELFDASRHHGFCFPADDSGLDYLQPAIVTASGHVNFWFEEAIEAAALDRQWRALGKGPEQIFPVTFRCLVPVDGREVAGQIDRLEFSGNEMAEAEAASEVAAEEPPAAPTARPAASRRGRSDQRTSRRRKAEIPVDFAQGPFQGTGVTGDVSRRGMFVRSPHIPGTGPLLRLTVKLPEGRKLVLRGRVVRNARGVPPAASRGFGLRLVEEWPGFEDLFPKGGDKS